MRGVGVLLAVGLAVGGCATVARGTGEQVAFDTVPSGAEVRVIVEGPGGAEAPPDGSPIGPAASTMGCVTPCVLQVKRIDKMAVTVTKPGYESEAFSLIPQVSGEGVATSIAGNLLIGGAVGALVDGASGAGLDKCPNPVRITLRPLAQSGRRSGPATFGYDAVAACAEQNRAKRAVADAAQQNRQEIR